MVQKIQNRYQFQMCGEGREYESLVEVCPLDNNQQTGNCEQKQWSWIIDYLALSY